MLMAKANEQVQSKAVGWMGNFNDMAVKTCLRRLIGKYGYMSVEIQDAFREEEGPSMVDARQDIINDEVQSVDLNAVEVEALPESAPQMFDANMAQQVAEPVAEATVFDGPGY